MSNTRKSNTESDIESIEIISQKISDDLIKRIKSYYKDFNDEKLLGRAVSFAIERHGSQKRYSGDPYYHHPVAVAVILANMKLDGTTIITALLHDTVEDTSATLDEIKRIFGDEVANLVDGVTKLTKIEFQSDNQRQAENFRKFLLALSEDIRVLIIKLADRLHNMRTIHYIKKEKKRSRISHETMEIYAPLAERIGMQKMKDELQDMSFKNLNSDGYKSVEKRLKYLRESDNKMISRTEEQLKKLMNDIKISAEISGREKMPYSIWRKMQKKNVAFEQLSDVIAFRVIVDSVDNCYRVLGKIHSSYHMIPDKFKDYISTSKANGYRSIHTIVMGPEQQLIEIQIRTKEMHEVAEMGVAAHWSYKQGQPVTVDGKKYRWIRELLYILENAVGPEEFLENTKLEMYHDQVFCFTPRGDLIVLPKGATPVDFAYAVHSAVGHSCAGAKINGRIAPLRTRLRNGDQVEIIQSKSQHPSHSWENFVVTGKALSDVRRSMRSKKHEECARLGKAMLIKALQSDSLIENANEVTDNTLKPLLKKFNKPRVLDIYSALGDGSISRNEIIDELFPDRIKLKKKTSLLSRFTRNKKNIITSDSKHSLSIEGLIPGMAIHFAGCCHPLPGEKIMGIVNSGKGVTIHTIDCGELENFVETPERWIDVGWENDITEKEIFVGRLKAVLKHSKGSLGSLANTVANGGANINNIRVINRSTDFFEMILDVEVHDLKHFESVMSLLRSQTTIHSVERYREEKNG